MRNKGDYALFCRYNGGETFGSRSVIAQCLVCVTSVVYEFSVMTFWPTNMPVLAEPISQRHHDEVILQTVMLFSFSRLKLVRC